MRSISWVSSRAIQNFPFFCVFDPSTYIKTKAASDRQFFSIFTQYFNLFELVHEKAMCHCNDTPHESSIICEQIGAIRNIAWIYKVAVIRFLPLFLFLYIIFIDTMKGRMNEHTHTHTPLIIIKYNFVDAIFNWNTDM